jgi:hypothetical protein
MARYSGFGLNLLPKGVGRVTAAMISALVIIFVLAGTRVSLAQPDSYGGMEYWMKVNKIDISPDKCIASAIINFDAVLEHIAEIRDSWLTRDKSADFYKINALPMIFGVLTHKVGGVLLQAVYDKGKDHHPDNCHFTLSLDKADQFGQTKRVPILGWDMTRSIASKIVWDSFDDRNLSRIALNYAFTPDADELLREANDNGPATASRSGEDCNKTLRLHGFLSRAQFQCGFADYSEMMMSSAKRCFAEVGQAASNADLRSGMNLFDTKERAQGHAAECHAVATEFSGLIRP